MDNIKAIKCYCKTNPDFVGAWNAADVKEELRDIGDIPENEWLEYLLSMQFSDSKDWTAELERIVASDTVKSITLMLDGHEVTIKKFYHTEF